MGCVCAKGINSGEVDGDPQRTKSLQRFVTLSRKDEVVAVIADVAISGSHGGTPRFLQNAVGEAEKKSRVPAAADKVRRANVAHQRRATLDATAHQDGGGGGGGRGLRNAAAETALGIVDVPKGFSGDHSVAGWPTWLTSVAGDAIKGWEPRRASSFEKLDKIGQGTYSSVYKAKDLETGKIVALKKVRFVNMDPESVRFMAREIKILRKLDHPNVIKLEGIITSRMSNNLYLVFEYMEHDLAGLAARPGVKFTEPQVKCYMRQLLEGLAHCHSHGILHRDIKGSNLLIDESGILKIADFGLATPFSPDRKQQLTSRVVTLWYRPPELLLGATEYGVAVDLWSSGCILAELLAGKPIMPGRTEVEQLHKIFKLCGSPSDEYWKRSKLPHATIFKPQHQYKRCVAETFKDFPPSALALLDNLLAIEPQNRGTTVSALCSEFFTTKPFACDPSSLPKYPPSKEYDAKLREEEKRRKKAESATGRSESVRPGRRESKATAELDGSVNPQRREGNSRATGETYNAQLDSVTVYPIDPPEVTGPSGFSQSGIHPSAFGSSWTKKASHNDHRPGRTYSSVRVENGLQLKSQRSFAPQSVNSDRFEASSSVADRRIANSRYNRLDVAESSDKHAFDRPSSTHRKDGFQGTDYRTAYGAKNKRMHYSGPLITTGGNIEDMLKEHERQIQQAVRKARLDKVKSKKVL